MKSFLLTIVLTAVSAASFAADKFVLNQWDNRKDLYSLVMDVNVICMDANRKTLLSLEGGLLQKREPGGLRDDLIFDFVDRWLMANYETLQPTVIETDGSRARITAVGGPGHIDYPNELEVLVQKEASGSGTIHAKVVLNYTSETESYSWTCDKILMSFPRQADAQ